MQLITCPYSIWEFVSDYILLSNCLLGTLITSESFRKLQKLEFKLTFPVCLSSCLSLSLCPMSLHVCHVESKKFLRDTELNKEFSTEEYWMAENHLKLLFSPFSDSSNFETVNTQRYVNITLFYLYACKYVHLWVCMCV